MAMPDRFFRFYKLEHAKLFVEEGVVSFGSAASYDDSRFNDAVRDDEQSRHSHPDPRRHSLSVAAPGGESRQIENVISLKISYDIRHISGKPLSYYILCCSLTDDEQFFKRFDRECYITINDVPEFHRRLDAAIHEQRPAWGGASGRVTYFKEGAVMVPERTLDLIFMKDTSYSWQKEFRYALISPSQETLDKRVSVRLGPLKDICSITMRP